MGKEKFELFKRCPQNPIIKPSDMPYPVNAVFNPGATVFEGKTLLLFRVEDKRGISHFALATSEDGISDWRISDSPVMLPDPNRPEEEYGIEDPRITYIDELGIYAIAYTAFSRFGPLVSLAVTKDFREFRRMGPVLPPENKDAALFPCRISQEKGFGLLHRPVPAFQGAGAHIWIGYGPDLRSWGGHRLVLPARSGSFWDSEKVGLGPPPLKTPEGWLILYHGVKRTISGGIYRCGLALLDLNDPSKVLKRPEEWVFGPSEGYELIGDVDKVVFPCGWVQEGDLLRIYYGAGDKSICLATASLSELLEWIITNS